MYVRRRYSTYCKTQLGLVFIKISYYRGSFIEQE